MPNNDNRRRFSRDRSYINMSGKVGGKKYELIDVENLKEANKQMAEMIRHQQEFIDKQDERIRNQEEISEQEREYYRNNKKNIEDMTRRMGENNKVISGWNRNIRSNLIKSPNRDNVIDNLINRSANNQRVPNTIADMFRSQMQKNNRKEVDEIYNKAVTSVVNSYKRKGADFTDPAVMNKVNRDIQDKVLANDEFNKITKKFGTKAELFNVAVNTFNKAISTWVGVFKDGLRNQTGVYENTFENISVRNGTTRSQYYNAQIGLQGQLGSAGVFNNIASSEVMTMWNTLANNGVKLDISNAEQTAKAIETVVTQHIVPYLDTNSKDFTILNSRIGDRFIKDIRGINAYNMKVAENSYQTQELMQEIIDQVQPMSDEALENLAQGSAEVTAMINKLTPIMGADAAKSYATQLFKTQRYSDQVMRSGSLTERMSLYDAIGKNINIYDPTQWNDFLGVAVDNSQMIRSWTPGYNSTVGGLITNVVGNASGEDYGRMWGAGNLTAKGLTGSGVAELTNLTAEELRAIANNKTNDFTGDRNQTNKKLQDVTVENLANEFAFFNEWLGNWAGVIETAIKGIGTLILTKIVGGVIGKGMGALTGLGGTALGTSSGVGFLFTSAIKTLGPLALIAGGIAIGKKYWQKRINEYDTKSSEAATGYGRAAVAEGYTEQKGVTEGTSKVNAEKSKDLGSVWSHLFSNTGVTDEARSKFNVQKPGFGDEVTHGFFNVLINEAFGTDLPMEYSDYDYWSKRQSELRQAKLYDEYNGMKLYGKLKSVGYTNLSQEAIMSTIVGLSMYAALHKDKQDQIQDMFKNAQIDGLDILTNNDILGLVEQYGLTKNTVKSNLMNFYTDTGEEIKPSFSDSEYDKFNLHRYGLASVPYDEYPALLHQGEAVLTATTATELRNLLEEYRQTSQQSINFDNIIQRQTTALLGKMDSIIETIEQSKIGTFSHTDNMHKARELLADSMRNMTSTKSF